MSDILIDVLIGATGVVFFAVAIVALAFGIKNTADSIADGYRNKP